MSNNINDISTIQLNLIKAEFAKRQKLEKSYSLRKFASDSNTNPSTVSQYFNGKRKLTNESFELMIQSLRLDEELLNQYQQDIQDYTLLGEKFHKIKSTWKYHGILEALLLYDFQPTGQWIADKLNIELSEAQTMIDDLRSVGILESREDTFVNNIGDTTFIEDLNMDIKAGREYQKGLISLALDSIDSNPGELKEHSSLCIAFDSSLIFEIKKKIDTFRNELDHFIQANSTRKDDIYSLQINFNSVLPKKNE